MKLVSEQHQNRLKVNCFDYFKLVSYYSAVRMVADWDKEMMRLLNYLIRDFVNNCILEYYAIPVLKIINGNVEVDESKSGRLNSLPFDILDCTHYIGGQVSRTNS